jgi:hypothetical protein
VLGIQPPKLFIGKRLNPISLSISLLDMSGWVEFFGFGSGLFGLGQVLGQKSWPIPTLELLRVKKNYSTYPPVALVESGGIFLGGSGRLAHARSIGQRAQTTKVNNVRHDSTRGRTLRFTTTQNPLP